VKPDWDETVRRFLREELGLDNAGLGPDSALVTAGLVDSAGLVRLAAVLERETGLLIPDRDINSDNFDTLRKIEAYLEARRAR
jgi:acyl carrier protein